MDELIRCILSKLSPRCTLHTDRGDIELEVQYRYEGLKAYISGTARLNTYAYVYEVSCRHDSIEIVRMPIYKVLAPPVAYIELELNYGVQYVGGYGIYPIRGACICNAWSCTVYGHDVEFVMYITKEAEFRFKGFGWKFYINNVEVGNVIKLKPAVYKVRAVSLFPYEISYVVFEPGKIEGVGTFT